MGEPINWCCVSFRADKMFWNSIVVVIVQFCEYTKSHQIVYFERENFMIENCISITK